MLNVLISFCYPVMIVVGLFFGATWIFSWIELVSVFCQKSKDLKSSIKFFIAVNLWLFISVLYLMYPWYNDMNWYSFAAGSAIWVAFVVSLFRC